MRIIVEGPVGCGKSTFIHRYLVPALREMGRGALFHEGEISSSPVMTLTGPNPVHVIERKPG